MSHSTPKLTVFDSHVTDFHETLYRHSTNKNTHRVIFIVSQSIILTLIVPSANSVSPLKLPIANRLIHAIHKNCIVYLFL